MKKITLATFALAALLMVAGCSADDKGSSSSSSSSTEASTAQSSEAPAADVEIAAGTLAEGTEVPGEGTLVMRQMYTAPHGTKSFAVVNVTMNGDTIVAARVDEFQYVSPDGFTGVPNSDGAFGENYPADTVLVSKEENNDAYSDLMKENGGATQGWADSMDAITSFATGKTVAELEAAVKELEGQGDDANPSDVVTGATFSDTKGYLQSIIDTAKDGMLSAGAETDATEVKEAQVLGAPHGDKSFAVGTVALDGDKIAVAFIDEFQFTAPDGFGGVPNSDSDFGQGVVDGQILISKQANNTAYSKLMADNAGATNEYSSNMQAVEQFAIGKTVAELEATVKELEGLGEEDSPSDVVTGATFSDTKGYLQVIIDAAKKAE